MNSFLPTQPAMRWTLAIVACLVAGLLGQYLGAKQERAKLADQLASQQRELLAFQSKYQSDITQLKTQRDVADASVQSLQESLVQLQAKSLEQASTQRLYNKIEGSDISSGLGVDTITRVNDDAGHPVELHVTLVQARGRNRVKGHVGVALVGEKEDTNWREVVAEVGSDSAPGFDMRFFQTLVIPIEADDMDIDFVEINVKPVGKRHKSFTDEVEWASILQE